MKSWMLCLLASVLSFGLALNAAEEKKEAKKEEKKVEKKEEKKEEKKKEMPALPPAVKSAWDAKFKGAEVVEIKDKKDSFEIKAKDAMNPNGFKIVYGADGKLWSVDKRMVAMSAMPDAAMNTAKKWAPGAKWADTAEMEMKKGEPAMYKVTAMMGEKKMKAEICEDGKCVKADKMEEKKEMKEEKKEEKKVEKKEEKK